MVDVVSWAKLNSARTQYYANSVAAGKEEYYQGKGEAVGRWAGTGAEHLGLVGELQPGQLERLAAGQHPLTGEQLRNGNGLRKDRVRVDAFDFTFSIAKSASLLYASGDSQVRAAIADAQTRAVAASLRALEERAAFVKRGGPGEYEHATGVLAAIYRHRTSRAGDPQLHDHVVIANMAAWIDGRWTALHNTRLRDFKMVMGAIHEAEFRRELAQRGLRWKPLARNGLAELECVAESALREFSKRRAEILAKVNGPADDPAAMAGAAIDYRRAKREVDWRGVQRDVAAKLGSDAVEHVRDTLTQTRRCDVACGIDHEHLAGPDGLTARKNTFDWRELVITIARNQPQGARAEWIFAEADRFLARTDVLEVTDGRFTVQNLVDAERARDRAQLGRMDERTCMIEGRTVRRGLRGLKLNEGQERVAHAVFADGQGYHSVQALAGTGKTTTAGAIRAVAELDQRKVYGVALAGRAVDELRDRAGIERSYTVQSFLFQLDHEMIRLGPRDVLVMDEVSMIGTRDAARIETYAHDAGVMVVAFGDRGQLQAIAAGGERRGTWETLGALSLDETVRQRNLDERRALGALHAGDVGKFFEWAEREQRVTFDSDPALALAEYQRQVREHAYRDALMIAPTHAWVDLLNAAVRADRIARGELGRETTIGELTVSVGDRVMFRHPDRDCDGLKLVNSTRGTVEQVRSDRLEVRLDDGTLRTPSDTYIRDGHVVLAYAQTGHSVQGATSEASVVIGRPDQLYQEWLYVAASRARGQTRVFYAPQLSFDEDRREIAPVEERQPRSARDVAVATARESRGEDLAIDDLDRGISLARSREHARKWADGLSL